MNIEKVIDSILSLTMVELLLDHKNNFDKAHESIIKEILIEHGFKEVNSSSDLTDNTFQHEPNGTQKSPDFVIKFNNRVLELDLKSSSTGTIMWNSHLPKPNGLYIYSKIVGKIIYDTTIFLGKDIIFDEQALITALDAMDAIVKEYNASNPNSDIHLFNRKMYVDKLGNILGKRNSVRRKQMESNAKSFILKGI